MALTDLELQRGFRLGPWTVIPDRCLLQKNGTSVHLEPMVMDVLLLLACNQGQVVRKDHIVERIWRGRATSDDAIATKIGALRNKLGDDSRHPVFVETVQKRGYRLKASVDLRPLQSSGEPNSLSGRFKWAGPLLGVLLVASLLIGLWARTDPIDSIGVVPFRNLSDDEERFQYIVEGFAEELVVSLGRVPDIRITRGDLASNNDSPQNAAKKLNVDAVISGSLRTDGNTLRITVEMTSAEGFQLWADRIDGASEEIFSIQERVAAQVQNEVLGIFAEESPMAGRRANKSAIDDYMLGISFLGKRDLHSLQQADALFEQSIEMDPGFGPAYLRQAITQLLLADYKPIQRREIYDAALAIARRGAQQDSEIREPIQLIHAFVHHQRGNWTEAASAFESAFEGGAQYPSIFHWHSRFLGDLGFLRESLAQAKAAQSSRPASQILNSRLAIAYMWAGDMENAGHYFGVANAMGVGVPDHYLGYALFLLRENRINEARDSVKVAFELAQRPGRWVDTVFDSLAKPGDPDLRAAAAGAVDTAVSNGSVPAYVSMMIWVLFEEPARAMDIALQEAAMNGVIYELELIFTDEFVEFRKQPQFTDLLSSLGVARYWASDACIWADDRLSCEAE